MTKFRDPETGENVDFDKVWEELQPATREELGMNRGKSMTFSVWLLIAVSIFFGIIVGMISITPKVLEVCK